MDELQMILHLYFMKKMHGDMVYHDATSLKNTMKNSLLCLANVLLKSRSSSLLQDFTSFSLCTQLQQSMNSQKDICSLCKVCKRSQHSIISAHFIPELQKFVFSKLVKSTGIPSTRRCCIFCAKTLANKWAGPTMPSRDFIFLIIFIVVFIL